MNSVSKFQNLPASEGGTSPLRTPPCARKHAIGANAPPGSSPTLPPPRTVRAGYAPADQHSAAISVQGVDDAGYSLLPPPPTRKNKQLQTNKQTNILNWVSVFIKRFEKKKKKKDYTILKILKLLLIKPKYLIRRECADFQWFLLLRFTHLTCIWTAIFFSFFFISGGGVQPK